jgi:putative glutathione S-transferase
MGGRNSTPKKEAFDPLKIVKEFPAASQRYHLYGSYACPFSHRTLIVRSLKGLEDAVSLSIAHPVHQKTKPDDPNDSHFGFAFSSQENPINFLGSELQNFSDSVNNLRFVRDLYEKGGKTGDKYSVPVLWDTESKKLASNDSIDISLYLNNEFNTFATNKALDLYPTRLRAKINEANEWISTQISQGVYKVGQAKTQGDYNVAVQALFENLDKAEEILSKERYICGNQFTLADIVLFTTLLRFDEIYYFEFKCNKKRICDYPHLFEFLKELYQIEAIRSTVHMDHIKASYYSNFPLLNQFSIIPIGPNSLEKLTSPHSRGSLRGQDIPLPPPRIEPPPKAPEQPQEEKKENVPIQVQQPAPQQEQQQEVILVQEKVEESPVPQQEEQSTPPEEHAPTQHEEQTTIT